MVAAHWVFGISGFTILDNDLELLEEGQVREFAVWAAVVPAWTAPVEAKAVSAEHLGQRALRARR